jgi:quinol monooxygenase YgiN
MEFAEQSADEAVQVLRSLVGPIRAEPGCTASRLLSDMSDGRVTLVEEWRDGEHLRRHFRAATFRTVLAVMELAATAPIVEIDEITSRHGFELVENALSHAGPDSSREGAA